MIADGCSVTLDHLPHLVPRASHWRVLGAALLLGAAPAPSASLAASPSADLRPSPSGHYVTYRGKTMMLIGDSGTQVVPMNGGLDLRAWLDQCKREGHSTVHIWAFTGAKPDDWRLGSGEPLLPWARRADGALDLLRFDDGRDPQRHYWARLRELCRLARERGLLVGITVFFGWAKDSGPTAAWAVHPLNRSRGGFAAKSSEVVRLADEREIGFETWSESWPTSRKAQWVWERFAGRLIEMTAPYGNVWFDYRDEWSYLNAEAAASEAFWRRFFVGRGCLWADRSGEGGLRAANPAVPALGSTPAIKTEGEPYEHDGVRREVWRRALSGVHYLLHNDAREPGIAAWDPSVARQRGIRASDDAGRRYVGLCARFMNRHVRDLDSMRPSAPTDSSKALWMVGRRDVVAYVPADARGATAALVLPKQVSRASWFDPRTGKSLPAAISRTADVLSVALPDPALDWVLHALPQ